MNTFLPYSGFDRSAQCLDRLRLGKQRLECLQILRTLNGETHGWCNHPAVKMWDGYLEALVEYGCAMCDEWTARGYIDNLRPQIIAQSWGNSLQLPVWLHNRRLIYGYRSNLVRKFPSHYRRYFPRISSNLPYYWPVHKPSLY